ncbi:hepatocyte growth factor-like protein [Branchiostoma floridae x Branchiostoma belcheri]
MDKTDALQPTTSRLAASTTGPPIKTVNKTGCVGNPDGSDYRGDVAVTKSGKTCQRWDAEKPHQHMFWLELFPELTENYCRNPSPESKYSVWCFTTDPSTVWEYCINPACPMGKRGIGCLQVQVKDRVKCGDENMSKLECEEKGCCYDTSDFDAPWCFFGTDK